MQEYSDRLVLKGPHNHLAVDLQGYLDSDLQIALIALSLIHI